MTPELRALLGRRAQDLRGLLNASASTGTIDLVGAAESARQLFTEAVDDVRVRWLNLELSGYGNLVEQRPLHLVLGVGRDDRLLAHVAAYRSQQGVELAPSAGGQVFNHFFVEPLTELVATRDRVRASSGSSELQLSFGAHGTLATYPTSARFPRDVFERITSGFGASLYLQLGALAR